jgi:hypothetical protein
VEVLDPGDFHGVFLRFVCRSQATPRGVPGGVS